MSSKPIRVVIVDDHKMVREGLAAMLKHHASQIAIVGEAGDAQEALAVIERATPDCVMLDIRLPGESGLAACRTINRQFPSVAIVILTVYEDEQYVFEAWRSGARGYLLKKISGNALIEALQSVARGERVIDPSLSGTLADRWFEPEKPRDGSWPGADRGLTKRESVVLTALVEGLSTNDIAEKLGVSKETVKSHVKAVLRKLGASDRAQAVGIALRQKIVT